MENAKKVILITILFASCKKDYNFSFIKENLYRTHDDKIVMRISNKSVRHPSKDAKWQDTIYQSHFRLEHLDSLVSLNDVLDVETYKVVTTDIYFEDKNYIYINAYYKPGESQYKIIKKDSTTIFLNKDSLKTSNKIYYQGNILKTMN